MCGVHVTHVYKDSVLARTGLKKGDVLCRVDGMDVDAFGELPRRWMNQRMTLDNLRCTLPLGRRVPIEYWSTKEHKLVRTAFVMRERSLPVRKMYPMFEPLDYVVYGGMVLMPLCLNHTTMYFNGKNKYIAPALRKYQAAKHCHEPTVALTKMLQGSFLSTLQLFDDDPRIVTAINHHPVNHDVNYYIIDYYAILNHYPINHYYAINHYYTINLYRDVNHYHNVYHYYTANQ